MKRSLTTDRLSMREAAKLLQVHQATIWRWALHGVRGRRLPTHMLYGSHKLTARWDVFFGADGFDSIRVETMLAPGG